MSYSEVSISGYNASPPPDDGTEDSTNEITWSGIKTKLTDPLKTAIESTQTNITTLEGDLETNLWAPATTAMLFKQTAAPTNWTKLTNLNDYALRLVSGSASTGGSTAFSTVFAARTILKANLPSYNLVVTDTRVMDYTYRDTRQINNGTGSQLAVGDDGTITGTIDMSSPASGTITAALGGSGTAMDFAVHYADVIAATKD